MSNSRQHVVLNFDDSAGIPTAAQNIDLRSWQEQIRFGCRWKHFEQLQKSLAEQLQHPDQLGCVLLGSGDYHHLTQLLLKRLKPNRQIHLIVCDNHPDNMRYPFGIHCGSWVYWASRLTQIARIDVIGISSDDISLKHAWENHWSPLYKGKLHYWSIQQSANWTKWIGAGASWHSYAEPEQLMSDFLSEELQKTDLPIYLSIDKDVLSKDVVMTNWDQGHFLEKHLVNLIQACSGNLIGADITGDVSAFHYQNRFKRFLSESDGQREPSQLEISQWQIHQQALNQRLLEHIDQAWSIEQ
ncbi:MULTISPECIES: hypothetical protein [unclassified Acinetobacter]|uniref:hypothetical protein n=1 Tax=Acinetobacter TaxID=469 RepID=UPI0018AA683A|nr:MULTISPECIES: hypothetical protein [unclassified Acinetobacter]MBJ9954484.1 hypothetical protein [Acinetobacter baumannii]